MHAKHRIAARSSFLLVFLSTFFHVFEAAAGTFAIHTPQDRTFTDSRFVNLVLRVGKSGMDEVRVMVNGNASYAAAQPAAAGYLCYGGIRLSAGLNRITVSCSGKGRPPKEKEITVFMRSALSMNFEVPPPDFRRLSFHDANSKTCGPCHRVDLAVAAAYPPAPDKSPCFTCHRKITGYKYVHGPAAVWSCLACHVSNPDGMEMRITVPDDRICADCHEDSITAWKGQKYGHGPTATGSCLICHNPHAADYPFFVAVNTTVLCIRCHADTVSRPHVIGGFSGRKGHPVKMSPDPFKPNRDFTCASCHNPHAGDSPALLNKVSGSPFCLSCHKTY